MDLTNKKLRLLIVDFTSFYCGGQKFILDLNKILSFDYDLHFALFNDALISKLNQKQIIKVSDSYSKSFSNVILLNEYIKSNKIDCVLLNGNRPIYFAPFLNSKKIAYKHTSNNAITL